MQKVERRIAIAGPSGSGKTAVFAKYLQLSHDSMTKYRLEAAHTNPVREQNTLEYQDYVVDQLKRGRYPGATLAIESELFEFDVISRHNNHEIVGKLFSLETGGGCYTKPADEQCRSKLSELFDKPNYTITDYMVDSHAVLFFAGEEYTTDVNRPPEILRMDRVLRDMRGMYDDDSRHKLPQHFWILLPKLDKHFDEICSIANLSRTYQQWTESEWDCFRDELAKKRLGNNYKAQITDFLHHDSWRMVTTTVPGINNPKPKIPTPPLPPLSTRNEEKPPDLTPDFDPQKMNSLFVSETIDGIIDALIASHPNIESGRKR